MRNLRVEPPVDVLAPPRCYLHVTSSVGVSFTRGCAGRLDLPRAFAWFVLEMNSLACSATELQPKCTLQIIIKNSPVAIFPHGLGRECTGCRHFFRSFTYSAPSTPCLSLDCSSMFLLVCLISSPNWQFCSVSQVESFPHFWTWPYQRHRASLNFSFVPSTLAAGFIVCFTSPSKMFTARLILLKSVHMWKIKMTCDRHLSVHACTCVRVE